MNKSRKVMLAWEICGVGYLISIVIGLWLIKLNVNDYYLYLVSSAVFFIIIALARTYFVLNNISEQNSL